MTTDYLGGLDMVAALVTILYMIKLIIELQSPDLEGNDFWGAEKRSLLNQQVGRRYS